jgi:hypothetical protein
MNRDEHIACSECGCVIDSIVDPLYQRIADLEDELAAKRREIGKLRGDRKRKPELDPLYSQAMEVLEHWRERLAPRTHELTGVRLEKVLARLHGGYDMGELMLCILGYASKPYVGRSGRCATPAHPNDRRHVDAELIFRDAKHVDAGIAMAAAVRDEARAVDLVKLTPVGRLHRQLGLGM